MSLQLLSKGYQVLKGTSADGCQIFRKIITMPQGGTQKLYAKVKDGQIVGNIEKNIVKFGDDCHQVRTTFSRANGEQIKSYINKTRKVDDGYTFTYGHSFQNSNKPVYEELAWGSNGKIYEANTMTNYGNFEHIIGTKNYKDKAYRTLFIHDRVNPFTTNNSGYSGLWLYYPVNFSSISNARMQGWFG